MLNDLKTQIKNLFTVMMLALFVTAIAAGSAFGQIKSPADYLPGTPDTKDRYNLAGTWTVTITPDDGSPSFQGFHSFGADGNASFASAGPPIPGLGNPGYGVWRHDSGNKFEAMIKMISYTTDFQFDGTLKIKAKIRMTGPDRFVTEDAVTIYAPDGSEIVVLGGNAVGVRMKVDD